MAEHLEADAISASSAEGEQQVRGVAGDGAAAHHPRKGRGRKRGQGRKGKRLAKSREFSEVGDSCCLLR